MIRLIRRLQPGELAATEPCDRLQLTFDERKRGRLSTRTLSGETAGLFLDRGKVLADGDRLQAEDGGVYLIEAAAEPVVEATTEDWLAFARVCYHLGNRHLPLQIGERWLRFQPDHVLQELVTMHGLQTRLIERPFQPETGAYGHHHREHGSILAPDPRERGAADGSALKITSIDP